MKKTIASILLGLLALAGGVTQAAPLGTAFTYQGRLDQNGQPATGLYQMTFWLYAASSGGSPLASNTVFTVPVSSGLFTTNVDFGANRFTGDERWLAITVATNGSSTFTLLQPRTRLAPTPNALYALTAGTVPNGAIQASQLGTVGATASGQVLTYNGSSLLWQTPPTGLWQASGGSAYYNGGNVGIGTTTPSTYGHGGTARILEVNNSGTALNSQAHLMLYSGVNSAFDSSIGTVTWAQPGGMAAYIGALTRSTTPNAPAAMLTFGTRKIGDAAASPKMAITEEGNVGIGTTSPQARLHVNGAILSGQGNTLSGNLAAIGGGENNQATADSGTIGGGTGNQVTGVGAGTVGGGVANTASGDSATVPGGYSNLAQGRSSFAAGNAARALHDGSFVWADRQGTIFFPTPYESTAANQFSVRASGGARFETSYLRVSGNGNEQCYLGGDGAGGDVQVGSFNPGVTTVSLYNAGSGTFMNLGCRDISTRVLTIYGGADLAEPFPMKEEQIEKGSVVVIDDEHPGQLQRSTRAYDTRVAGIVSGANGINPGISLKQEGALDQGENVALTGRVYVKADASHGAIKPGDLLTTSDTPGHAMKVTDHTKSQGAILGKAMSALKEGTGLVLVLVTLQ